MALWVIGDDEAIVEQVPRVALPAVAIEHLAPRRQVPQALDNEAALALQVVPNCLLGQPVIQHIGERGKDVRLHAVDIHAKHSAAHHGPRPTEFLERVGRE